MTQQAPLRLSDAASDATPELRAAVRHARGDGPTEEQLQRLMNGVIGQLPAPPATDATSNAAPSAGLHGLRWLLLIAIGAGAVLALHHALRATQTPIVTPHASVAVPEKPPAPPAPAQAEPSAEPAQPAAAPPPAPSPATRSSTPLRVHRPVAAVQDPRAEITLLQQARRALASAPDQALALTQSHARQFPDGVFREEREALAIEALLALGRHDEAKSRAHSLFERYPQSAYRRRIERLLAGTGGGE